MAAERRMWQKIQTFLADLGAAFRAEPILPLGDPGQSRLNLADLQLTGLPQILQHLVALALGGQFLPVLGVMAVQLGINAFQTHREVCKTGFQLGFAQGERGHIGSFPVW